MEQISHNKANIDMKNDIPIIDNFDVTIFKDDKNFTISDADDILFDKLQLFSDKQRVNCKINNMKLRK